MSLIILARHNSPDQFPMASQLNYTQRQNATAEPHRVFSGSNGFMKRAHSLEANASGVFVSNGYTFSVGSCSYVLS